jgi:hypothetical protein
MPALPRTGKWTLTFFSGKASPEARSQLVFLQTALAQYPDLDAIVGVEGDANSGASTGNIETAISRAIGRYGRASQPVLRVELDLHRTTKA